MNLPLELAPSSLLRIGGCLAAAALMGCAIQRGATCTVAAVDEIVTQRRCTRLLAIGEAALWVLAGLLACRALVGLPAMPHGYPVTGWTVAGGALLGLGAFVNRGCVFGALARLGSGEWAYAFTPVGYLLGCASAGALGVAKAPAPLPDASPALGIPAVLAWLLVASLAWRGARLWRTAGRGDWLRQAWSPHVATCVIGLSFLWLLLVAGPWAYTDVLAEIAQGMAAMLGSRIGLAAALVGGAVLAGRLSGRWRPSVPDAAAVARCVVGGVLMAWGTLMIPGGNDGLLLLGMPLLWPYAWTAFVVMCATIASAMLLRRRLSAREVGSRAAGP